ncbi:imidazole glycerol phosphate synthase cyclase subunit [Magnetovibrio sp. PR-2]|uniref:imidazole glycerol phosphate synthase subunit HisF n=1 Tax=Magnetovibrio sp. PR-2 TaxID=3120356 RepID=UPI002FCE24C2
MSRDRSIVQNGLKKRLIPSLLLKGHRLVKGKQFADWEDSGRADTTAKAHNAQGADELVLLDIEASREQRAPDLEMISKVAMECFMPLTVGGGVDSLGVAHQCFEAGADKVCITTTALDNPDLISELANTYGRQAILLGVDVKRVDDRWELYDFRTQKTEPEKTWEDWLTEGVARGAGEVRLMSVDREGERIGMDLDLLQRARAMVDVPVILEGGAGTLDHLAEAFQAGADAVCAGTMLIFSDNNLVKVKRYLASQGIDMRL